MREFEVRLKSVQDVLAFVGLATKRPFPIRVGSDDHLVNGKSFMEMFCLNLRKPVKVRFQSTDEEFQQFCQDAQRFLVK